jgi:hypothetical protein
LTTTDINGGTVDGTTIGATTPSTVVATQVDITAQGDLRLQDTTGGQFVALQAPATVATSYTLTLPVDDGTSGQALITDGSGVLSWSSAASGDVYGPASATDNAVARYDGTTGKIIQNSAVTIADDGTTVISTNSTSDALRITQTGTGNALLVEDSASPDSSPFVIDASGNLIKGNTAVIQFPDVQGTQRNIATQVIGNSFAGSAVGIGAFINAGEGISFTLAQSRSATVGNHTVVAPGDTVGVIQFAGSDGTNFIRLASIDGEVDGTPGTNDMPGRLVFSTTADGASTPTERMRINNSGQVLIGNATSTDAGVNLLLSSATGSATPVPTEMRIQTTTNGSDWSSSLPWGRLSFYNSDGSGGGPKIHAAIDAIASSSTAGGSVLSFQTGNGTNNTLTERARFTVSTSASDPALFNLSGSTGLSIARTAVTAPIAGDGNVFSGTYTPTLTNTTNVTASTAYVISYMRVGNVVTVGGKIDITPTATGAILIKVSLPIASNFVNARQAGGTLISSNADILCAIGANATDDLVEIIGNSTTTVARGCHFSFTYLVV